MTYLVLKRTIYEEIYTLEAEDDYAMSKILEIEDISNIGTRVSNDVDTKIEWWEKDANN